MLVAKELKLLREKLLLTQKDFADELGVSESTINRWETGKVRPNITAMRNIKKFCEINGYEFRPIENAWVSRS